MEKQQKKRVKKYVSWVCIVVLVALLAAMPMLAGSNQDSDGPEASILSGTAARGDIDSVLVGGGSLTEETAVQITIPASVKLTKYLVANGDAVAEGDPVAKADRVSVMSAITQVQETLEYIADEIESASEDRVCEEVNALAGGTVKIVYAEEGEAVQDIMLRSGALAVLSLDDLMAVDLETESTWKAGARVAVTLSDGTTVEGKVKSNLNGTMTVTLEDDDYAIGEAVQVADGDGVAIGSGELYIHNQWNATAYSGTIRDINVKVGDEVDAGDSLMELEDTGHTAEYETLSRQHREYEELMLELFRMYQSETVTAPADGVISGVDEDSAYLLSNGDTQLKLTLLANAPNGNDEAAYANYVGQVSAVGIDGWVMRLNPQVLYVTDYMDLNGVPTDPSTMTQDGIYSANAPVYELTDGQWVQIDASSVAAGDILLFAADTNGSFVWVVRIARSPAESQPTEPTEPSLPVEPSEPTQPVAPADPTEPTQPGDPGQAAEPTTPGRPEQSGGQGYGGMSGAHSGGSYSGGYSGSYSGGYSGGFSGIYSGGMAGGLPMETEPEYELYGLETVTIASVTAHTDMTMEITVDELDISKVSLGQTAEVTVDALSGEHFTATVTRIGNSGTNEGGNSKFTVELTLKRSGDMLPGMNATATIVLDTSGNALTVPLAALVDEGSETFLYTSYDEETGTLGDPVYVTIGVADEENAEVLSGLEEGATYYYAYYDTLVTSNIPDMSFSRFGG